MTKVTASDVAERAGVSRSAVSRVFTPGASVSEATAKKVKQAAEALGYRPNRIARSLLTGKSRMIGLVAAYLDNLFYPQALEQLSRALQDRGYHVLMFMTAGEPDLEHVVADILGYQVDGLVLASVTLSDDLAERCAAAGVPVVLFNRLGGKSDHAVVSDNYEGGLAAGRHLISRGCQRLAYLAGDEAASTQADREAGFRDALSEAGLSLQARAVGAFSNDQAIKATHDIFGAGTTRQRPDGLFAANDLMAIKAMDVLRYDLGLRVPDDVAVVGFDNTPVAGWPAYDLTSVAQDSQAMVDHAIAHLLGEETGRVTVSVKLIARSSTAR